MVAQVGQHPPVTFSDVLNVSADYVRNVVAQVQQATHSSTTVIKVMTVAMMLLLPTWLVTTGIVGAGLAAIFDLQTLQTHRVIPVIAEHVSYYAALKAVWSALTIMTAVAPTLHLVSATVYVGITYAAHYLATQQGQQMEIDIGNANVNLYNHQQAMNDGDDDGELVHADQAGAPPAQVADQPMRLFDPSAVPAGGV